MAIDYHEYIKTEAWHERAESAKQRVGHRCQICNRPATRVTLNVHHRTYERLGNERPEDLTVLCRGCYELYEKNRRIPSPPAAQPQPAPAAPSEPLAQAQVASIGAPPDKQPAQLNGVAPRRPFAPARGNPQRAPVIPDDAAAELILLPAVDHSYTLANEAASPAASHYQLTPAHDDQPKPTPTPKAYRPKRRQQVGVALLVATTLLLVVGLYDLVRLTPNALRPLVENTRPATVSTVALTTETQLSSAPTEEAPPTAAALANNLPASTATQAIPTLQPTVPPTATPLPPSPTAAPLIVAPTVAPTPASSVVRSGLVCGKPCSCAPVVSTITQGTPVTVLTTQLCGSDTWYQIGEAEWLGPGLVDPQ